jgi:RNA chaperone Hfq
MVNRKLVRPNLAEMKEKFAPNRSSQAPSPFIPSERETPPPTQHSGPAPQQAHGRPQDGSHRRRQVPPENTSAEAFYYVKQMNNRTPMVVVLDNGNNLRGHIEWYDRGCIKVNREGAPNLLVYKHAIKYMYKQEEEASGPADIPAANEG